MDAFVCPGLRVSPPSSMALQVSLGLTGQWSEAGLCSYHPPFPHSASS